MGSDDAGQNKKISTQELFGDILDEVETAWEKRGVGAGAGSLSATTPELASPPVPQVAPPPEPVLTPKTPIAEQASTAELSSLSENDTAVLPEVPLPQPEPVSEPEPEVADAFATPAVEELPGNGHTAEPVEVAADAVASAVSYDDSGAAVADTSYMPWLEQGDSTDWRRLGWITAVVAVLAAAIWWFALRPAPDPEADANAPVLVGEPEDSFIAGIEQEVEAESAEDALDADPAQPAASELESVTTGSATTASEATVAGGDAVGTAEPVAAVAPQQEAARTTVTQAELEALITSRLAAQERRLREQLDHDRQVMEEKIALLEAANSGEADGAEAPATNDPAATAPETAPAAEEAADDAAAADEDNDD